MNIPAQYFINNENIIVPFDWSPVVMESIAAVIIILQNLCIVASLAFGSYALIMWTKVRLAFSYIWYSIRYFIWHSIWQSIWKSLTPGQQWIELVALGTSIMTLVIMLWFFQYAIYHLEQSMEKEKQESETKSLKIAELEKQLEMFYKNK